MRRSPLAWPQRCAAAAAQCGQRGAVANASSSSRVASGSPDANAKARPSAARCDPPSRSTTATIPRNPPRASLTPPASLNHQPTFQQQTRKEPSLQASCSRNYIVGGGVFAHANVLPCSIAWDAFGEANGASSLREMRSRIAKYRKTDTHSLDDFRIGCRILTQPFFLDEAVWWPVPSTFASNIVRFKGYKLDDPEALALWELFEQTVPACGTLVRLSGGQSTLRRAVPHSPTLGSGCLSTFW